MLSVGKGDMVSWVVKVGDCTAEVCELARKVSMFCKDIQQRRQAKVGSDIPQKAES